MIATVPDRDSEDNADVLSEHVVPGPEVTLPRKRKKRARASTALWLRSIAIENLRNYNSTSLELRPHTTIVGNNNEGKSSALRIVDWIINQADTTVLTGGQELSAEETALLLPANDAHHKARRVTMHVCFDDGRKARRYQGEGDSGKEATLRVSVMKSTKRCRLNVGRPRRSEDTDDIALELLELIREQVQFILVPSARDARSSRFRGAVEERAHQLVLNRFEHGGRQAGAPSEYRQANKFLNQIRTMVGRAGASISGDLQKIVPADILKGARLSFRVGPDDLADWIRSHLALTLTTGVHDNHHVDAAEVGNGLQSLIDLALALATFDENGSHIVLVLEEPEAFLHPSAQRLVAQKLRSLARNTSPRTTVVTTTHSPYLVEEASFEDVTLVRNHHFYQPKDIGDRVREEINSALMTVPSAELFFSHGVLLVEGPGDRAFFERILRRYQVIPGGEPLARLVVLDVGGKRGFVPWWRLLSSYGPNLPIKYHSLFDADAASKDSKDQRALLSAFESAKIPLSAADKNSLIEFGDMSYEATRERTAKAKTINLILQEHRVRVFSIDFEWAAFGGYAAHNPSMVRSVLECEGATPELLAKAAGSKVGNGRSTRSARKQPYRRNRLAEKMDLSVMPIEIKEVVRDWFSMVLSDTAVRKILSTVQS